nr:pentatricopeptide repeat-containing protein At1g74630 [Ipomoea trifida]
MNSGAGSLIFSLLGSCRTLKSVKQLHAYVCKTGLESDQFIAGKLLIQCAVNIADALDYARRLFLHIPNPDVFMYNTLIRGLAESDSPQDSLETFVCMLRSSEFPPDSFSFAFTLKAAANMRCLKSGSQLHCQALARGLDRHLFVGTTTISMYAECGTIGLARNVFDEMSERNVVAWNAILTAYLRGGDLKGADGVFDLMPLRDLTSWNLMLAGYAKAGQLDCANTIFAQMPTRDSVSWSTMIFGLACNGYFDEAFRLFRELRREGMSPNEVSLTGVLSACAQAGEFEFAKTLHGFIEKAGMMWITSVNNALLDTYARCGNVAMARLIFERIPGKKSVISWTCLITGLIMQGHGEEAMQLFHEMESTGTKPDGVIFVSILYACSHAGLIQEAQHIFDRMSREYGMKPDMEHYGCMVDLYSRAGQLKKAYDFITQMPIPPNAIIWRTLLGACSFYGDVQLAEVVKQRLSEVDPNNSGDHVLLSNVYAVAGKWQGVASVRRSMTHQKMKKTPGLSVI